MRLSNQLSLSITVSNCACAVDVGELQRLRLLPPAAESKPNRA